MTPRRDPRQRPSRPSWATYRRTIGDRSGLFAALARDWAPARALYPGSYLDASPSTAIPSVTYLDTDRRAARYFADHELVAAELTGRTRPGAGAEVQFLHADYTTPPPPSTCPEGDSTCSSRSTRDPPGITASST